MNLQPYIDNGRFLCIMEYKGVDIRWLHHNCFRISGGGQVVYTDPYKVVNRYADANTVLITHDHYDHLDVESLKKVVKDDTTLVAPRDCKDKLDQFKNKKLFVSPNEIKIVDGVTIKTVPSYNVNKFRTKTEVFHPKDKGNVGYIFIVSGVRFYIGGDTDFIPEMNDYRTDVALIPISGIYVMTAEEAAKAAMAIKADLTIPAHYGAGIGTAADAKRFVGLLKGKLKTAILESSD